MANLPTCDGSGKIKYPTQLAAIRSALRSSRRRGTPLRPYWHKVCQSYHLTSQPKNQLDIRNGGAE